MQGESVSGGLREGGLMKATSEEGMERGMDGARERGSERRMDWASGGGIERGREGAWEQGKLQGR